MKFKPVKVKDLKAQVYNLLVYGYPGSGKTYFLGTLPKPLIIDFEGGTPLTLKDKEVEVLRITNRNELKEFLVWFREEGLKDYSSLAFDGFSIWVKEHLDEIVEARNRETPTFYEWGLLAKETEKLIRRMVLFGKPVVFTALRKDTEEEIETQNGKVKRKEIRPDLPRSIRATLVAMMDGVGLAEKVGENDYRIVFKKQKPNTKIVLKDRSGKLEEVPNNYELILQKVFGEVQK